MPYLSLPLFQSAKLTSTWPAISRKLFHQSAVRMATQYKLNLSSLDLKPGELREVEIDGVSDSKILLANTGGKTTALSSKCTHYGAPLAKGVLTSDGRLTCPWHGACFNAKTGDVEDAPALDGLSCFPLVTKDDGVYIEAEEATLKANRKKLDIKSKGDAPVKVAIVGGGSGAQGAIEELRTLGFNGNITLISSEPFHPVDRTKLSKALIPDSSKIALRDPSFYSNAAITCLNDEVTSVDFQAKTVATASGKSEAYDKLILATGGTPRRLPLPGFKDLSNIFVLRTISDVQSILAATGSSGGKQIVVIGSSFIGMEAGNALAGKGHKVTIVGMEAEPLERVMGTKIGAIFRKNLCKNENLSFKMSASVDSATPSDSDSKAVGGVKLKDGTLLPADLVVLGVGVAPATSFLKSAPGAPTLRQDGSLETDASFAVKGLKDVYAIGDIATFPYHGPGGSDALTRIEHWNVAQNSGRIAARAINGSASPHRENDRLPIPVFWSALGSQLRYCGNTVNGYDALEVVGDTEGGSWAAFYAKGEEVVAVATMGKDPWMVKSAELMRVGKMPSLADIKGGLDVLAVEV